MNLSTFGQKFSGDAGITVLMEDITNALSSGRDMIMMGGGNPANVPEIDVIMQQRLQKLSNDSELTVGVRDIFVESASLSN